MTHGDDTGIVVPPRLAPAQVVVVPIYRKEEEREGVVAKAHLLRDQLVDRGVRVRVDDRDHLNPGAKFYEWERKGVPFRIEVGPRDLEKGQVVLVKRVTAEGEDRKEFLPEGQAVAELSARLDAFQKELLERARARRETHSHRGAGSIEEVGEILDSSGGFVYTGWSGDPSVEERIKAETKATLRCIPDPDFRSETPPERCVGGERATSEVLWARAY